MAEFCLDCWNKMNHIRLTEEDVILSEDLDLCEGCATMQPVIVIYRKHKKKLRARCWGGPPAARHPKNQEPNP